MEMKVIVSAVARDFTFKSAAEIRRFNTVVTRPYVKGRLEDGAQLPIRVFRSRDPL